MDDKIALIIAVINSFKLSLIKLFMNEFMFIDYIFIINNIKTKITITIILIIQEMKN